MLENLNPVILIFRREAASASLPVSEHIPRLVLVTLSKSISDNGRPHRMLYDARAQRTTLKPAFMLTKRPTI